MGKTDAIHVIREVKELDDEDNVVWKDPAAHTEYVNFVHKQVRSVVMDEAAIRDIITNDYEKEKAAFTKRIEALLENTEALTKLVAEQNEKLESQRDENDRKVAELRKINEQALASQRSKIEELEADIARQKKVIEDQKNVRKSWREWAFR